MSKKVAKKPKIETIEGLAVAMQEGFSDLRSEMQSSFKQVHERIDSYAAAAAEDTAHLREDMSYRFDSVDEHFDAMETRLIRIEGDISELKTERDRHDTRISGVESVIIRRR